jgi:hypothetical protein
VEILAIGRSAIGSDRLPMPRSPVQEYDDGTQAKRGAQRNEHGAHPVNLDGKDGNQTWDKGRHGATQCCAATLFDA